MFATSTYDEAAALIRRPRATPARRPRPDPQGHTRGVEPQHPALGVLGHENGDRTRFSLIELV